MVSSTPKRCAIIFKIILASILGLSAATGIFYFSKENIESPAQSQEEEEEEEESEDQKEPEKPVLIDLQPTVEKWLKTLNKNATIGLEIYDIENEKVIAKYNEKKIFYTESLYKLFVVYEGYKKIENDEINGAETLIGQKTILECLDLAIRESNSPCAESLKTKIGAENIEKEIKGPWNLTNSSNISLTSTPEDITKMMKIYYEHKDLSEEIWEKIKDSMLNQPPVDNGFCSGPCDWRRGLPSGFSEKTKVYNKVGWLWNDKFWRSYHDTAIVEIENHTYIITAMTSKADFTDLRKLAQFIEADVLKYTDQ